ncbi:MAG: hypothetical protein HC768_19415 [Acaryochloris sp. CRU_2_0]|nr:hypothetical protein [Acaryochloris sp. CRU_2_0]
MSENLLDQIFQALQATSLVVSFDGDQGGCVLCIGNGVSQLIISGRDVEPCEQED